MTELRYPLTYQCKRCGEIYDGLHRSKTHVKEEHGIAWKRTRKELRVMGIHELLPDPELLPSEREKVERVRRKRHKRRPFKDRVFAMGWSFTLSKGYRHEKIKRKNQSLTRKLLKTHQTGESAYKGYLNNLPIFGLQEVVKRG